MPLLAPRGRRGRRPAGASPRHDRRLAGPRRPRRPTCPPSCSRSAARSSARGPGGEREIPAAEFFDGFLETALAPDEVLTEIRVPKVTGRGLGVPEVQPAGQGLGHRRRRRRARTARPRWRSSTWAPVPLRAAGVEQALAQGASAADAARAAAEGTEPPADRQRQPRVPGPSGPGAGPRGPSRRPAS